MDCLSDHSPIRQISFMKGAQIGATELGLNWIGYVINHAPGPMMGIQPTDSMAKRFSNQRLKGLLSGSVDVSEKVSPAKSRDSGNTMLLKEFQGGILLLAGANSAAGLSSIPVKYLFLDEVDRYPIDLPGEWDPIKLAEARTRTFSRKKIFRTSTPTISGQSQIEQSYKLGDQRKYFVPCPFCGHEQVITWDKIKFDKSDISSVHMECVECKEKIKEHHKTKMLENGRWIATASSSAMNIRSYHLSSLYSPVGWYSWRQAVEEFLECKKNEVRLRVFINTVLGEPWQQKGEAPEWKKLFDRRELYAFNKVPREAPLITAGADIQKDRIEVEIVAWNKNFESWSLDYRVFRGDTSGEEVYGNLDALLEEEFPFLGPTHPHDFAKIRMLAVDTGYNSNAVYVWCRGKGNRVMPVKGVDSSVTLVSQPSYVDLTLDGKKLKRGVSLWKVGASMAKTELYGWLGVSPKEDKDTGAVSYPAGYCHFPQYDVDYFKMLTAEHMTKKVIRGYSRYVWEKIRERNEALDARCYARCAAYLAGMDRMGDADWEALVEEKRKTVKISENVGKIKQKRGVKFKKSSGYW